MWLEGLFELKFSMISLGIETVTVRLVAQCLNQLRYHVTPRENGGEDNDKNPKSP
jgi:hypothetical protein